MQCAGLFGDAFAKTFWPLVYAFACQQKNFAYSTLYYGKIFKYLIAICIMIVIAIQKLF